MFNSKGDVVGDMMLTHILTHRAHIHNYQSIYITQFLECSHFLLPPVDQLPTHLNGSFLSGNIYV